MRLFFCFAFFLFGSSFANESFSFLMSEKVQVSIGVLSHPQDERKSIFYHLLTPNKEGPFPLVVYLHDGQMATGFLGSKNAPAFFHKWLDKNIAVLIPSFPGFGFSDGPCDYCGEFTLSALSHVIDNVKTAPLFEDQKIALCGFSYGAIAAVILSHRRNDITCTVATSGVYDLEDAFKHNLQYKWNITSGKFFPLTKEELKKRSSFFFLDKIHIPLLFVHAEDDPYISVVQSIRAYQKIKPHSRKSCLCIIKQDGHYIPEKLSHPPILRFLEEHLF